ncbi:hypothetical protein HPB47_017898, partial [Ixodes persulcatus]
MPRVQGKDLELLEGLRLSSSFGSSPLPLQQPAIVYLTGYLVHACKEKVSCPSCKTLLEAPRTNRGAYKYMADLDSGGLTYPTEDATSVCSTVCTFVESALKTPE